MDTNTYTHTHLAQWGKYIAYAVIPLNAHFQLTALSIVEPPWINYSLAR